MRLAEISSGNVVRIAFICWVGEGVPPVRKGLVTKHCSDVQSFLPGFHCVIQARSEDDISEQILSRKLNSSVNY